MKKTDTIIKEKLVNIANFLHLLLLLVKENKLPLKVAKYIIMLTFTARLPTRKCPLKHYPKPTRVSFINTQLKPWQIAADFTQSKFQIVLPLDKHCPQEEASADTMIEIIMSPHLVYLLKDELNKYGDVFDSDTIKEAFNFICHYEPRKYLNKTQLHISNLNELSHTFLDHVRHYGMFNTTASIIRAKMVKNENTILHDNFNQKSNAADTYESIHVADVGRDLSQCYGTFNDNIVDQVKQLITTTKQSDNKPIIDATGFFNHIPEACHDRSQTIQRKAPSTHKLFIEPKNIPTRCPMLMSTATHQSIQTYLNEYALKVASINFSLKKYQKNTIENQHNMRNAISTFNALSDACVLIYMLLTSTRPILTISQYQSLDLEEHALMIKEKGEKRIIYLHPRLSLLIKHYMQIKQQLAKTLDKTTSDNVIFEYITFTEVPSKHKDIKTCFNVYRIEALKTLYTPFSFTAINVLRHHFNYLLINEKMLAKDRNLLMGHGDNQARHTLVKSAIKNALENILQHYSLEHVIDALINKKDIK